MENHAIGKAINAETATSFKNLSIAGFTIFDSGSAKHFPDPNFFCSLNGAIRSKTKQTKTGNENGQYSKIQKQFTKSHFVAILFVKKFIEEKVTEGPVGY